MLRNDLTIKMFRFDESQYSIVFPDYRSPPEVLSLTILKFFERMGVLREGGSRSLPRPYPDRSGIVTPGTGLSSPRPLQG